VWPAGVKMEGRRREGGAENDARNGESACGKARQLAKVLTRGRRGGGPTLRTPPPNAKGPSHARPAASRQAAGHRPYPPSPIAPASLLSLSPSALALAPKLRTTPPRHGRRPFPPNSVAPSSFNCLFLGARPCACPHKTPPTAARTHQRQRHGAPRRPLLGLLLLLLLLLHLPRAAPASHTLAARRTGSCYSPALPTLHITTSRCPTAERRRWRRREEGAEAGGV
jgi:hypothetical protein